MTYQPIHDAAQDGDVAALRRELDDGVSPNALDRCGWTPLHYVCLRGGDAEARVECVHMLIEAGADVNAPSVYRVDLGPEDGEPDEAVTPLHHAAQYSNKDVVAALIKAGADVNRGDYQNATPLHSACWRDDSDVGPALVLIKNGADVNVYSEGAPDTTPLDDAVSNYDRLGGAWGYEVPGGLSTPRRHLVPILLRAGAALDAWEGYEADTWPEKYIQKAIAAGGIKNHERTHLNAIAATFIPKLPLLPPEMVRRVVEYAFHVGDY